jgi:hypothetical protein
VTKLTNEKKRLNAEDELNKKRMAENEEKQRNIAKVEDETKKVERENKKLNKQQKTLKQQFERMEKDTQVRLCLTYNKIRLWIMSNQNWIAKR